jgi:hypothetical protein
LLNIFSVVKESKSASLKPKKRMLLFPESMVQVIHLLQINTFKNIFRIIATLTMKELLEPRSDRKG